MTTSDLGRRILLTCVCLAALAAGTAARADDRVDATLAGMHKAFEALGEQLGVTPEQKAKLAALEKSIGDRVRANPAELDKDRAFKDDVMKQFRTVLTPEQQKKLDEMIGASEKRAAGARVMSQLRQIGMDSMMYANANDDALPADLGVLVEKHDMSAGAFVVADPDRAKAVEKQEHKQKAEWVRANADFVYLGGGKTIRTAGPTFVLAYVKPEAAAKAGHGGGLFLMGDGSVQTLDAPTAAKVLADLKAGKNPPPALAEKK